MFDITFKFPFSWCVCGGSGSGKTTHVLNFLSYKDELMSISNCKNVIYHYNQWQPSFDEFRERNIVTEWNQGLPTLEDIKLKTSENSESGTLLIIDDFYHMLNQDIVEMFTVLSHHGNLSVILLAQSLFGVGNNNFYRAISLNSTYISVFKNPRDNQQIATLSRQLRPSNWRWIVDAYYEATKRPYSYLFIDNHQKTCEEIRIRSNILPSEGYPIVWVPMKELSKRT